MHGAPPNEWIQFSRNFIFRKLVQQFETLELGQQRFDVIYYDVFAPSTQPQLWAEPMLKKMFNLLRPNGVLTTYCAKGEIKRLLTSIGFRIEALPGPKGKREMTRAVKPAAPR